VKDAAGDGLGGFFGHQVSWNAEMTAVLQGNYFSWI
jgi:hypothetical protein